MTLSKTFLAKAHHASKWTCTPRWALKAMKHIMNNTVKRMYAESEADLLSTLIKKKLQPNNVTTACNKLCSHMRTKHKEKDIAKIIMKEKLHEAQRTVTRAKRNAMQVWRENRSGLTFHKIRDVFDAMWMREKDVTKKILKQRLHKKVTFLCNDSRKTKSKSKVNDVLGIVITNQDIPPSFESNPRIYDGTNIIVTEAETALLSLGPKFAVYEEIDEEIIEVELQKSLVKVRWDRMNEERNDEKEGEEEESPNGECNSVKNSPKLREWPYNVEKQTMNLAVLRPTDLPFNKEVVIPEPLNEETENQLQMIKNQLTNVTRKYIAKNKIRNKELEGANLSEIQKEGLNSLTKRKDAVIFQTDKSGRLSIDSKANYVEASKPHYEKDIDITEEIHERAQKEANGHSVMWSRMLRAGEGTKNGKNRVKTNLLVENNDLASQYTLRKDHKESTDANKGPPVRPVCGATNAYNNKLSHLLSMIIKPMNKLNSSSCRSSEEMIASIQQANEKGLPTDTVVGSLDVKALYPSIDVELSARVVANTYVEHSYEIVNVNYNELSLYLAINMSVESLSNKGIAKFCHTRKHKRGRKPLITGCATSNDEDKRYAPWNPPETLPNDKEARIMLAEAIYIGIKFTMSNHIYCFDDKIKKQAKGGPIGLELTGEVAMIFMTWWDKQFKMKLRDNDVKVYAYQRYVDDIDLIVKGINNKSKCTPDGKVVHSGNPKATIANPDHYSDSHTLEMVKKIGNGVTECIKLEVDYPSNHQDNKLPILDMKVWPTLKEKTYSLQNQYSVNIKETIVVHEFYQKEIANKSVVQAKSAMSYANKRRIVTQEILRVLLRCSPHLPWNQVLPHLNNMMMRIQYSV